MMRSDLMAKIYCELFKTYVKCKTNAEGCKLCEQYVKQILDQISKKHGVPKEKIVFDERAIQDLQKIKYEVI